MIEVTKIIDELCLMIFLKYLKIDLLQSEIDQLHKDIETIEHHIRIYEEGFNGIDGI